MKTTKALKKILSGFLCAALIATMALSVTGCDNDKKSSESSEQSSSSQSNVQSVGKGKTTFDFTVTDTEENETQFDVHTDKTTVGEALLELDIIAGDNSEYGLYVKTVNGITLDFDNDGYYWAFYVNGEYAQTGVDLTDIKDGEAYAFRAEKG